MKRIALVVLSLFAVNLRADDAPNTLLKARPEAIEAWKDMRFGMFICWGPVTLTGEEIGWSRGNPTPVEEYDNLYKKWNPDKFDAREWAKVVKDTGARYVVFLLKHHDGFCLWDTKQTDYNIMNGPFKRDVTKEFADACREQGIGFFPYYSTCDWHHPDFPVTSPGGKVQRPTSNLDRYTDYLEAQVKELITGCGPLVGIWFDVPQRFDRARGERVIRYVRSLQPNILVNNRTGAPGDFDTPEQHVGRFQNTRPWESCITLGTQWTWKPDDKLKSYTEAVRMLVVCATGDGNLALNTNPMPDGRIEPRQVESFRKIGAWLQQCGESIYGTRGGPFIAPGAGAVKAHGGSFALPGGAWWGGATRKGNIIYLHILRWPTDTITLPAIHPRIVKHTVLTGGEATVKQTDTGIEVSVSAAQRDAVDTIVKLELDAPAKDILVITPKSTMVKSLTTGKKATASNWFQKSATYAPDKAVDGDPDTRWGCDWGTHACWLEVDLGAPQTFDRAAISEPYGRVKEFELQVWQDDAWKTFHRGKTIGEDCEIRFPPVTGQRVRLNLLKTTDGPSIWEFQLFEATSAPQATVVERRLPNGNSELRLVDAKGIELTPVTLNLSTHHRPATSADDPLMTKWRSWQYGGFVCFNDNQFVGSEFSKNKDPQLFNPSKLDIAGWAATMKSAGMNYAVLTTRHTSGFLLWDSATTEFDVASSPCKTDVAGEFVKQCQQHGIVPGFYYCLWGGPEWMPRPNARAIILAQLHELATRYGAIPYFWIDMFNWAPADITPQEVYDLLKNINPNTVVILNQHIQDGSKIAYFPTDVLNGEVHLPPASGHQPMRTVKDKPYYLPFEFEPVSQRIAKGTTTPWGRVGAWFTYRDSEPFPAKDVFDWIQQAVALGAANILLSCAPDHTGQFRDADVRQLNELGNLLRDAGLLKAQPNNSTPQPTK